MGAVFKDSQEAQASMPGLQNLLKQLSTSAPPNQDPKRLILGVPADVRKQEEARPKNLFDDFLDFLIKRI